MGVHSATQARFTELAQSQLRVVDKPEDPSEPCLCCGIAPRGRCRARVLGYGSYTETLPESIWRATCSAGNPFALGAANPSETVVDLGCGSGVDVCIAALMVGPSGRVVGIDANASMLEVARANAEAAGVSQWVEFIHAPFDADSPDIPEGVADVVISNGALNLASRRM